MTYPQRSSASEASPELVDQIAEYADLALAPERAALLAPLLMAPLAAARALRPEGYDDLQPSMAFRVPREG